ncbi:MAG: DUF2569 family protein [Alcaligenaceae bacterium]|nr:DUF2569 family protein [Alcaligenaceae bacterium]
MSKNDQPKGIRGWLLFYVIANSILLLMLLVLLYEQSTELFSGVIDTPQSHRNTLSQILILLAVQCCIAAYILWRLIKVQNNPKTVKVVIRLHWLSLVVTWIMSFLTIHSFSILLESYDVSTDFFAKDIRSIMFQASKDTILTIIWVLYFMKSKRVRNTYGLNANQQQENT